MNALRLTPPAVMLLLLLPGCFLDHGLEHDGGPSPRDSAARPDAALRDSGAVPAVDSGALPAEPDPDLGPDARPSDYPEAADWTDPPEIDDADPCCVLGEPIRIVAPDEGINLGLREPLHIRWGADRWAVLTWRLTDEAGEFDFKAVILELARDGRRLGPARVLDLPMGGAGDLLWAEGRWAVMTASLTDGGVRHHGRLYDRGFAPASPILDLGPSERESLALAHVTHSHRWIAFSQREGFLRLRPFDEEGLGIEKQSASLFSSGLRAVGLRSRAAVLMNVATGRPSSEIVVIGGGEDPSELGRIRPEQIYLPRTAITAVRDLVVIADVYDDRVTVEVLDPFAMSTVGGTNAIADNASRDVEIMGSSKLGVVGMCYRLRDRSQIEFQLVGMDGLARGRAVQIGSSNLGHCAVGEDADGFLVAWWDHTELWVRRVFVAE